MNSLRAVEAELPPGFRFHPKDEELICDYLMKRAAGCAHHTPFLIQLNLNNCEPWDIPEIACVGGTAWYFYTQRDRKYATGLRTNRATLSGYWKATGKDRPVIHKGTLVGMRKTLVFYHGRAPKGSKTDWVMHEFRLEWKFGLGPQAVSYVQECTQEDWVLCRVFHKNPSHPPRQHTKSGYNHHVDTDSSSPRPPVSLPCNTLDQFQANDYHSQLPCFSFYNTAPLQTQLDQQILPTNITPNSAGLTPNLGGIYYHNSNPCDEKVIQAALGHFTKIEMFDNESWVEGGSCSGDQGFSESYISDVELHSIWN